MRCSLSGPLNRTILRFLVNWGTRRFRPSSFFSKSMFNVSPPAGAPQRGGGGGGMGRGRGRRDNELIGQTVRISQGPYKGGHSQWHSQ